MKFLVDECVGTTAALWLKSSGFDTVSIYDEQCGIKDDAVLHKAVKEDRILITSDKDFGDMIFRDKKFHVGIILLRLLDERPQNKINIIEQIIKNHSHELYGNFTVATEKLIRIIRLTA